MVYTIKEPIAALVHNPRPHNRSKLTSVEAYRIRVGNYCVIYEIHNNILIITVVEVADRKQVYKKK